MSKNEGKIALAIDWARTELEKVDTQTHGAKTRIVQDLAQKLKPLLPLIEIAEEITTKLKGKVGKTLVYKALGNEYKNENRVKAQRKPKKKNVSSQVNLKEEKPLVQVAATGESVTIGHEPKLPPQPRPGGSKDDFEAALLAENFELKQTVKEQAGIIKQQAAEITRLKEPFTFKIRVDIGRHRPLAEVRVRPALKEVASVSFPEQELPSEMFV